MSSTLEAEGIGSEFPELEDAAAQIDTGSSAASIDTEAPQPEGPSE